MIFGKAGADGNIKNEKGGLRRPFKYCVSCVNYLLRRLPEI
jgi:hypothetical protein